MESTASHLRSASLLCGGLAMMVAGLAVGNRPVIQAPWLDNPSTEQLAFFETRVRPVFAEHCFSCHGDKVQMADLRLDTRAGIRKGGISGPAIVPGDPGRSLLAQALRHAGPIKMPKGKRLGDGHVADIEAWIAMGAPWPAATTPSTTSQPLWSLQPVRRPQVPKVKNAKWVRNPVDAFVLAKLEAQKLGPAPEADRRTLIRRLTFDLIGLPPTPAEVDAFVADKRPDAYERLVDRLLASPRHGERWARHWLDVARYADTKGYMFEEDRNYYNAYTYREWVIRAFNEDLPYDQFVVQQLAADRLPEIMQADDRRPLAALGFLTVGRRFLNSTPDILDDRIDVTTRGFMGFSVACARCHDHKFDPIPTQDYYSLYAVFNGSQEATIPISPKAVREPWEAHNQRIAAAEEGRRQLIARQVKRLRELVKGGGTVSDQVKQTLQMLREETPAEGEVLTKLRDAFEPEEHRRLRQFENDINDLRQKAPPSPEFAMAMVDRPNPSDGVVFKRGNPGMPGEPAPRRFLAALSKGERSHWSTGSGRLELARAIASPQNPLTARVIVNRVWMHHIGQGLVRTPSDFGRQGDRPTHPELLDYLAARFVAEGWSLKRLHKLIVTSATYRQASTVSAKLYDLDPDNRLLARMNRRRLDLEQMRDAVVAATGKLDVSSVGGKSVDLWKQPFTTRRAVYGFVERQNLPSVFRTFDFASPDTTSPRRFQTTVPQQALFFLNSPFLVEHAKALAARPDIVQSTDDAQRVRKLYRILFSRLPDAEEAAAATQFLSQPTAEGSKLSRMELYVQGLLMTNEFLFVD